MKELENIISELVSINRRLANNFKTEEGKELRADLFDITQKLEHYKQDQALQLQQTGVSGCFSYKEALEFLQLHTPIAVKPIKKSKYKFVQPFTSKNARDIVIFSLATELSKNNR